MQVIALKHIIFVFVGLLCFTPLFSSASALIAGMLMALLGWVPSQVNPAKMVKKLLAIAIVGLGFGVSFSAAKTAAITSLPMIVVFIIGTFALAWWLAKLLRIAPKTATLIGAGTAICGGSAVAAVAPTIQARNDQIAVALGVVFVLNALALLLFPALGYYFQLTPEQFGLWAALAIHDTSSVVGAAEVFAAESLPTATAVKLLRAMAIAPVAIICALLYQRWLRQQQPEATTTKIAAHKLVPGFILFYVLAIAAANLLPQGAAIYSELFAWSKRLLVVCLYLVGSSLSLATIRQAGWRPLLLASVLWLLVSAFALLWILA